MEKNHLLDLENQKLKEDNTELARRLEGFVDEREQIHAEVMDFSRQHGEVNMQLKHSQDLLKRSEIERAELRNQYIYVGEKFECLMDMEEKE